MKTWLLEFRKELATQVSNRSGQKHGKQVNPDLKASPKRLKSKADAKTAQKQEGWVLVLSMHRL